MKQNVTYTTTTHTFENAVVRVHRPVLDEKEKERRYERIKKATAELLK
jgi:hypothetical protein